MGDGATTEAGYLIGRDRYEECIHVVVATLLKAANSPGWEKLVIYEQPLGLDIIV